MDTTRRDPAPAPAARPARLVCCGLTTLDVVQTVDRVPGPDEKVVAHDLHVSSGGPAANAAVTAVALGVEVVLVTRVGDAPLGRLAADDLAAHGVEVVDLAGPGDSPALSTVLVTASTGERAVVSVNDRRPTRTRAGDLSEGGAPDSSSGTRAGRDPDASAGPSWEGALGGVDAVLVDGHHLDLAVPLARAARRLGIPVLLDGGSWKPGLDRLLAHTDVALLSADFRLPDEVLGAHPPDDLREADVMDLLRTTATLGPGTVARSQGAGPLQLLVGPEVSHSPADRHPAGTSRVAQIEVPAVDVHDTLGAGDVLHGALAAWLAQRTLVHGALVRAVDLVPGLQLATSVASASCSAPGARGWLADDDAVGRMRGRLADGTPVGPGA